MKLLQQGGNQGIYEFLKIGDTDKRFSNNLKIAPDSWYWRTQPITYDINSQGYRSPEWEDCDWSNSVILFGGSTVYGLGVHNEATLSFQLSCHLNCPVINLGGLGVSTTFHWTNTILLNENNIKPKSVVYIWPVNERFLEFHDALNSTPTGRSHLTKLTKALFNDKNTLENLNDYMRRSCHLLWSCPVYHFTEFKNFDTVPSYITELPYVLHESREGFHPGPNGYALWAQTIVSIVNSS